MVIPRAAPLDFDDVFRTHFSRVARTMRSLGVDSAAIDDATQDVFVILHRKLHEFEGRSALATWIYAVTFRVAQNHRRKSRFRAHEPLSGTEPELSADPGERFAEGQAAEFVQRFWSTWSEAKRDAFVLCVVEGRSPPEVAELLGITLSTLYSRVAVTRKEFRRELRRVLLIRESQK
jgi:RNA polymerase sigma-70 factor (ECF subfamily)